MDRCYKLKVLIIVLTCVLIPTSLIYSNELDTNSNIKASPIQAKTVKQQKREVINITNEELLLLSKLVINRVKDPRFPNTIKDVIYQKNAFSVVKDGSINMQPTESAYTAAQDALYGNDPTNNAIYFWNPDIATCNWIKTLNPYMRIGNHVFAK